MSGLWPRHDPRRQAAAAMLGGYALILVLTGWANVSSMAADLRGAGVRFVSWHPIAWEATSLAMWMLLSIVIWQAVARARPPMLPWAAALAVHLATLVLVSLIHVAGAVLLRDAVYALAGETYDFGDWWGRWLYEFRKDAATYVQLAAFAAICQWVLMRLAPVAPSAAPSPIVLHVADGAITRHVPAAEIDHVTAAGNYVELAWRGRTLLHRATLSAVALELGADFVRIHRSRLVRRAAIRAIEVQQSGDFEVELVTGGRVRGSRRYRENV